MLAASTLLLWKGVGGGTSARAADIRSNRLWQFKSYISTISRTIRATKNCFIVIRGPWSEVLIPFPSQIFLKIPFPVPIIRNPSVSDENINPIPIFYCFRDCKSQSQ